VTGALRRGREEAVAERFAGVVGVVGLAVALGALPRAGGAQQAVPAGTVDFGVGAALLTSHQTHPDTETLTGFAGLAHVGYVATGEKGTGWLQGQLELLLEPTLIHLGDDESATLGGAVGLARWIFTGTGPLRPFVEGGVGVVGGQADFRQTNCDVNFIIEGGPGVLVFVAPRVALTAGYRFQHLSNSGICSKNLGLNSSVVHVGLSYFFP
jgi:hypothetical protein